jgi:hypothetical protein
MRIATLAILILASLARWTTAEINSADTLEWIAADSTVIAVGKVEQATKRGTDQLGYYDLAVRVTEKVKGAPGPTIAFAMWGDDQVLTLKGREVLVFLVEGKRYARHHKPFANEAWVPRSGGNTTGVYDLAKPAKAFTASFDVIDQRAELLAAVRVAAKSTATKAQRVDAPADSPAFRALYGGSTVWMFLPVDGALEQLAVRMLASKSSHDRADAVSALEHFKSAANTKRLLALLADPGFADVSESGKPTVRRYLVRKRAHEVLTAWGVAHKPPVIDEPKP